MVENASFSQTPGVPLRTVLGVPKIHLFSDPGRRRDPLSGDDRKPPNLKGPPITCATRLLITYTSQRKRIHGWLTHRGDDLGFWRGRLLLDRCTGAVLSVCCGRDQDRKSLAPLPPPPPPAGQNSFPFRAACGDSTLSAGQESF